MSRKVSTNIPCVITGLPHHILVVRRDIVSLYFNNQTAGDVTFDMDVCASTIDIFFDADFRELCVIIFDKPIN